MFFFEIPFVIAATGNWYIQNDERNRQIRLSQEKNSFIGFKIDTWDW